VRSSVVLEHSNNEILGSSPVLGVDVRPCVVLSCAGRGLVMGRSPVQGHLPKCLKGFVISEVNSDSEQVGGPNP